MNIQDLKNSVNSVNDPRRVWGNLRHKLEDILIIALLTVVCYGYTFEDMDDFGKERFAELKVFLDLPNGIPDADTFRRVLQRIKPLELSKWLADWLSVARGSGRLLNVDGKTIRGSGNGEHEAYHVVSVWSGEQSLSLGELEVGEKSNEIVAVPKLLQMLDIKGDIVTADAMSCQRDIAATIKNSKANYILALKGNQPTIEREVTEYFDWLERESPTDEKQDFCGSPVEKGHGRIERREVTVVSADWFQGKKEWAGLKTFVRVRSYVTANGNQTVSVRQFISSLDQSAKLFCSQIRGHWSIENNLHWCLDVLFGEDASTARKDNSPLNMNILRKFALSLLKAVDMGKRVSLRSKRYKAALNPDLMMRVLIGE